MLYAYRLRYCLKYHVKRPGWNDGWTLQKSFLVVKGGVRAKTHRRRLSTESSSEHTINTSADRIIDTETFLWLAVAGRILYKDFPTTEEINDKSKADWFSKAATLVQLIWVVVNMVCRLKGHCTISVMEVMILDWMIFGLIAMMMWWKCPQNIKTSYIIPVQDFGMQPGLPPSDHDPSISTGALLDHITVSQDYEKLGSDDMDDFLIGQSCSIMLFLSAPLFILRFVFWISYQWHSAWHKKAWITFTAFSTVADLILFIADPQMRFDWCPRTIYSTYLLPIMLEPRRFPAEDNRNSGKWLALARGMGIYNPTDLRPWRTASQEVWHDIDLKAVVVAVLMALICQSGKLVISVMAFTSAPQGIYDVPNAWILEALVHLGG